MKKAIILIAIMAFTATSFAQVTSVQVKKKSGKHSNVSDTTASAKLPKGTVLTGGDGMPVKKDTISAPKAYLITLYLNEVGVTAITGDPMFWNQIERSPKASGAEISFLKDLAAAIRNEIWRQKNVQDQPAPPVSKKTAKAKQ